MAIRNLNGVEHPRRREPGPAGRRLADPHGVRARPYRALRRVRRPGVRARGRAPARVAAGRPPLVRRRPRGAAGGRAVELPPRPADACSTASSRCRPCTASTASSVRRTPRSSTTRELDGVTLDLALNGIGPDGHTASLFPGAEALEERERRAVAAEAGLEPFVERVTLTPPVFGATRLLVYLVTGDSKASAVRKAFAEEPSAETPGEPDPRRRDDRDPRRGGRVAASSGIAARAWAVRDERPEAPAVPRDEPVRRARRAADRAVGPDDVDALEAHRLWQRREQRPRRLVVEREPGVAATVDPRGDTRHEAAEASIAVVQHDRTGHGRSSDSSSGAAMPRRAASACRTSTVSATGMSSRYTSRLSNDSSTASTAST